MRYDRDRCRSLHRKPENPHEPEDGLSPSYPPRRGVSVPRVTVRVTTRVTVRVTVVSADGHVRGRVRLRDAKSSPADASGR